MMKKDTEWKPGDLLLVRDVWKCCFSGGPFGSTPPEGVTVRFKQKGSVDQVIWVTWNGADFSAAPDGFDAAKPLSEWRAGDTIRVVDSNTCYFSDDVAGTETGDLVTFYKISDNCSDVVLLKTAEGRTVAAYATGLEHLRSIEPKADNTSEVITVMNCDVPAFFKIKETEMPSLTATEEKSCECKVQPTSGYRHDRGENMFTAFLATWLLKKPLRLPFSVLNWLVIQPAVSTIRRTSWPLIQTGRYVFCYVAIGAAAYGALYLYRNMDQVEDRISRMVPTITWEQPTETAE